jgi:hypothetical protein
VVAQPWLVPILVGALPAVITRRTRALSAPPSAFLAAVNTYQTPLFTRNALHEHSAHPEAPVGIFQRLFAALMAR